MASGANQGAAAATWLADALRLMDTAVRTHVQDPALSLQLGEQAQTVLGSEAFMTLLELGKAGKLPQPGCPGFEQFIELAASGDVEIVTVVLVKDHEWVSGDAAAEKIRKAPALPPPTAPISLKEELTAMGLLGSATPPPRAVTAAQPPRIVTPPDAGLRWQPPDRQPTDVPPRLTVEIIPSSLHGKNPRTHFGRAWWDVTRKAAYATAGYRCEICGGRGRQHPVELHERYGYDEHARPPVQRITGLIVLCPACHAVKHLYRTGTVAAENGDPAVLQDALRHLREVNGWTEQQLTRYLAQVRREYERRERLGPWIADYSALAEELPSVSSQTL